MSEETIDISFPVKADILLSLRETKEQFTQDLLYLSALMLYRKRRLSLGKAAELAGYAKLDFIDKLKLDKEPIFDYGEQDLDEILADARKLP